MFVDFARWLESTAVSETIQAISWVVPLMQSIHIVTLAIVYTSVAIITLRIFGLASADDPIAAVVRRYLPVIWIGLLVLAATGGTLVVGEPVRQFTALSFWLKMGLLLILLISGAVFSRALTGSIERGDSAAAGPVRSVAAVTIVLWTAIIFLGRAIAYDVEVWGSLSLTQGL